MRDVPSSICVFAPRREMKRNNFLLNLFWCRTKHMRSLYVPFFHVSFFSYLGTLSRQSVCVSIFTRAFLLLLKNERLFIAAASKTNCRFCVCTIECGMKYGVTFAAASHNTINLARIEFQIEIRLFIWTSGNSPFVYVLELHGRWQSVASDGDEPFSHANTFPSFAKLIVFIFDLIVH